MVMFAQDAIKHFEKFVMKKGNEMKKITTISSKFKIEFDEFKNNKRFVYIIFDKNEWNYIKADFLVNDHYLFSWSDYYEIDDEVLIDEDFILIKFKTAKIKKDKKDFNFYQIRPNEIVKVIEEEENEKTL